MDADCASVGRTVGIEGEDVLELLLLVVWLW